KLLFPVSLTDARATNLVAVPGKVLDSSRYSHPVFGERSEIRAECVGLTASSDTTSMPPVLASTAAKVHVRGESASSCSKSTQKVAFVYRAHPEASAGFPASGVIPPSPPAAASSASRPASGAAVTA